MEERLTQAAQDSPKISEKAPRSDSMDPYAPFYLSNAQRLKMAFGEGLGLIPKPRSIVKDKNLFIPSHIPKNIMPFFRSLLARLINTASDPVFTDTDIVWCHMDRPERPIAASRYEANAKIGRRPGFTITPTTISLQDMDKPIHPKILGALERINKRKEDAEDAKNYKYTNEAKEERKALKNKRAPHIVVVGGP